MANRSRSPLALRLAKVGSSTTPEEATLGIYYAILLQGNCVFISGAAARASRKGRVLLPCLVVNCKDIIGSIISSGDDWRVI